MSKQPKGRKGGGGGNERGMVQKRVMVVKAGRSDWGGGGEDLREWHQPN